MLRHERRSANAYHVMMQGVFDLSAELVPVSQAIASGLARVEEVFDSQLASDLPPVSKLVKHVENYRGKMLRPTLVLACGLACSNASGGTAEDFERRIVQSHVVCGAVVEMVHMATLVHDDVLDEADMRRRGKTVNRLHGNEAAVILGDYLIAGAYHLCSTLPTNDASLAVGKASMVTCAGELLQLHHRDDYSLDEATYFEIVARKTADLIATSAELGAICSGADAATREALRKFGRGVGIAFQVQDDILDLLGSEKTVGKSVGKDAEKGKMTLPIIHHLAAADARTRARMLLLLEQASGDMSHEHGAELVQAIHATDSLAFSRVAATKYIAEAKRELAVLPESAAKKLLLAMADAVVTRAF